MKRLTKFSLATMPRLFNMQIFEQLPIKIFWSEKCKRCSWCRQIIITSVMLWIMFVISWFIIICFLLVSKDVCNEYRTKIKSLNITVYNQKKLISRNSMQTIWLKSLMKTNDLIKSLIIELKVSQTWVIKHYLMRRLRHHNIL